MRFIITASHGDQPATTAAEPPVDFEALFAAYMKFNEDLYNAGVLVASEGLNPEAKSARVGVAGGKRTVLDGPFAESKELVGGFYLIDVPSLDDAIAWALRCPTGLGFADQLEIRQLTGSADIPQHLLDLSAKVAPAWTASLVAQGR